jgi:hypothetical protein
MTPHQRGPGPVARAVGKLGFPKNPVNSLRTAQASHSRETLFPIGVQQASEHFA